mmetsp:Transcript_6654/g.16013  ORF Transcript_6654/g.16013 Transcript_6654/m.16013 type:complete len:350 (-) Transcript_6654:680-1729(-)
MTVGLLLLLQHPLVPPLPSREPRDAVRRRGKDRKHDRRDPRVEPRLLARGGRPGGPPRDLEPVVDFGLLRGAEVQQQLRAADLDRLVAAGAELFHEAHVAFGGQGVDLQVGPAAGVGEVAGGAEELEGHLPDGLRGDDLPVALHPGEEDAPGGLGGDPAQLPPDEHLPRLAAGGRGAQDAAAVEGEHPEAEQRLAPARRNHRVLPQAPRGLGPVREAQDPPGALPTPEREVPVPVRGACALVVEPLPAGIAHHLPHDNPASWHEALGPVRARRELEAHLHRPVLHRDGGRDREARLRAVQQLTVAVANDRAIFAIPAQAHVQDSRPIFSRREALEFRVENENVRSLLEI